MSVRSNESSKRTKTDSEKSNGKLVAEHMKTSTLDPSSMAVSSSLNSIHITPRTPLSSRMGVNIGEDEEDVELSLLGADERRQAAFGLEVEQEEDHKKPISLKDKKAMVLLCVLCEFMSTKSVASFLRNATNLDLIQGVPVCFSAKF